MGSRVLHATLDELVRARVDAYGESVDVAQERILLSLQRDWRAVWLNVGKGKVLRAPE